MVVERVELPLDWPRSGRVEPGLVRRVKWQVAKLAGRERRLEAKGPGGFDLTAVYRVLARRRSKINPPALRTAMRWASTPAEDLEVSAAALALALAARHRARSEGLLAILELCYTEPDREQAAVRLEGHLRQFGGTPEWLGLPARSFDSGWPSFARDVRQLIATMPSRRQQSHLEERPRFDWGTPRTVLEISGGLGNQLFQYAAALAYAKRNGARLLLDLRYYERPGAEREFVLGRLQIPIRRAAVLPTALSFRRAHREVLGERDSFILGANGSALLRGYWEDSVYFGDVIPALRQRFQPRDPTVTRRAGALVERARNGGSGPVVGVHLRRGDRVPGGKASAPFSTLSADYYREAASRFPEHTNFLVFSDSPGDVTWCRTHLGLGDSRQVSFGDGLDPVVDLFALAGCDHVILSAGTFSWWAGWLGERRGRRVIVPNGLQAMNAARVMSPPSPPPLVDWEVLTLPPSGGCFTPRGKS